MFRQSLMTVPLLTIELRHRQSAIMVVDTVGQLPLGFAGGFIQRPIDSGTVDAGGRAGRYQPVIPGTICATGELYLDTVFQVDPVQIGGGDLTIRIPAPILGFDGKLRPDPQDR